MKLLKEKLVLQDSNIIKESEEEKVKETSEMNDALQSVINTEISNTYNNINDLKSILATVSYNSKNVGVEDIINEIIDNRTVHIGMLQTVLSMLGSDSSELIETGEDVAEKIAGELEANEL